MFKITRLSILYTISVMLSVSACNFEKLPDNDNINESGLYSEGHQDLFKIFNKKIDIIMLGDSLTDENEWHEFFSEIKIINRGIRGESSNQVLDRIKPILKIDAKYIFVMIGINDIFRNNDTESILRNIEEILHQLQESDHTPILQSLLYVSADQIQINNRVTEVNKELIKLAENLNIQYVDLNIALAPDGYLESDHTYDGIHLTGKAYKTWANQIKPIIDNI